MYSASIWAGADLGGPLAVRRVLLVDDQDEVDHPVGEVVYSDIAVKVIVPLPPGSGPRGGVTGDRRQAAGEMGASTFAELIAYAKAYPGKLTYASPGVGTIPYLSMEALLRRAGISMVHVPYTALPQGQLDLIAGRIGVILDPAPARAIEFHKEGKLKILAVASDARDPRLPDLPAISEVLPGYEKVEWLAMVAPPKTPAAIAEKLSREIAETLRMPDVAKRLTAFDYTPVEGTPADLAALIRKDSEYWCGVIGSVGLTKTK